MIQTSEPFYEVYIWSRWTNKCLTLKVLSHQKAKQVNSP